jgi:hypothetical protein
MPTKLDDAHSFSYSVELPLPDRKSSIWPAYDWCLDHLDSHTWALVGNWSKFEWWFKNLEDAVQFELCWGTI